MGLLLTWTGCLVLWIVLWAIGGKALDAFMLVLAIMISAAAVHIVWPLLPGNKAASEERPDPAPYT
jgi:hypothetical protein